MYEQNERQATSASHGLNGHECQGSTGVLEALPDTAGGGDAGNAVVYRVDAEGVISPSIEMMCTGAAYHALLGAASEFPEAMSPWQWCRTTRFVSDGAMNVLKVDDGHGILVVQPPATHRGTVDLVLAASRQVGAIERNCQALSHYCKMVEATRITAMTTQRAMGRILKRYGFRELTPCHTPFGLRDRPGRCYLKDLRAGAL